MEHIEEKVKEEEILEANPDYLEGELILAVHGDQLYDAKILQKEVREGELMYFVHYRGWNKSWDEWLGRDRVLKHNKENIEKQQALKFKNHSDDENGNSDCTQMKKRRLSTDVPSHDTKSVSECKRLDASVESSIDIKLPSSLKKLLVRDWDYVTQQEKLVKLPCFPAVEQILSKYLDYMLKNNGMLTDSIGEFLKGLKCYFDKALPMILLYEKERSQYRETVLGSNSPSAVYGAQHLLRLFVKLPDLMVNVSMDKRTAVHFQDSLNDFIRFLKKNRTALFTSPYHTLKASEPTQSAK